MFSQETSATSGFSLGSIRGMVFHVAQSWLKNGTWELTMATRVNRQKGHLTVHNIKHCLFGSTEQKMLSSIATPMTSPCLHRVLVFLHFSHCFFHLVNHQKSEAAKSYYILKSQTLLVLQKTFEVFDKTWASWAFCIVESAPERVTESPTRTIARHESFIWKLGWDPSWDPNHSQAFKFKGVMLGCWDDIAMFCGVSMFALFSVHSIAALNQIVKIYEVRQSSCWPRAE